MQVAYKPRKEVFNESQVDEAKIDQWQQSHKSTINIRTFTLSVFSLFDLEEKIEQTIVSPLYVSHNLLDFIFHDDNKLVDSQGQLYTDKDADLV